MKYFTPAILNRLQSDDEDVFASAHDEWETAIVRYRRRWAKIKNEFPESVRRFKQARVCLHDAELLSMGREGEALVMVLQPEPPAETITILTFTLDGEPTIDPAGLPGWESTDYAVWLYEEFDLDRQKRPQFEVLFSNGWSVKLRFHDFHYQIAQRLFPVPRTAAKPAFAPPQTPVSQPA